MTLVQSKRGTNSYFLSYIRQRLERNKNFLCAITGPTGSGKTYSSLRLAELLDADFAVDRVVFSVRAFMELLNSGRLKRGAVIVLDEAGIALSSKTWQSMQNRLMNFVMQSFRHKNYIVLFTSPDLSFLDAASRKLLHCYMETQGIDMKQKLVKLKPFLLQTNQRDGAVYYKFLRVITKDGGIMPLKQVMLGLPSPLLLKSYELKKTMFTAELNKSIMQDLDNQESFKGRTITRVQEQIIALLQEGKVNEEIANTVGLQPRQVREHIEAIKRKGYEIIPHKDGVKVRYYEVIVPKIKEKTSF